MKMVNWIILLFVFILSLSIVQAFSIFGFCLWDCEAPAVIAQAEPTIIKSDGGISIENDDYVIDIELENTGHVPSDDSTYLIDINKIMCKTSDCQIDFGIVTPVQFISGSSAQVWFQDLEFNTQKKDVFCDGDYGWVEQGVTFYCTTENIHENVTGFQWLQNDTVTYDIVGDYYLDLSNHPDNASIHWNETTNHSIIREIDLTDEFSYYHVDTLETFFPSFDHWGQVRENGNHTYILKDRNLKQEKEYKARLTIKVNPEDVPIKYSVVIFDRTNNKILVLDPTVVSARTWTTEADFINGTITTNLTTSGDKLTLTKSPNLTQPDSFWRLDTTGGLTDLGTNSYDLSNNGADYNATCTKTVDGDAGCYDFVKANADYMVTPAVAADMCVNEMTVSFWHNIKAVGASGYVMSARESGTGDNWMIGLAYPNSDEIIGSVWDTGDQQQTATTDNSIVANTWQFITVRVTAATQDLEIFVNGVEASSYSPDTAVDNFDEDSPPIYIGQTGYGSAYYDGQLKWISIYCEPLTDTQIKALMNDDPIPKTQGILTDRQGWCPQTDNTLINLSIEMDTSNTYLLNFTDYGFATDECLYYELKIDSSGVYIKHNQTNSSLDSSNYITIASQTDNITSYTLSEAASEAPTAGTLTVVWKDPTSASNHTQNTLVTYTGNVSCSGGDCGNINITLDPQVVLNGSVNGSAWDAFFDEDTTRTGVENILIADFIDGGGELPFLGFNMTALGIPADQQIDAAELCLQVYLSSVYASNENLDVWYVDNQTWTESGIDQICGDGVYCDALENLFTTKTKTYQGNDFWGWNCINGLEGDVQTAYDAGDVRITWALNHTGDTTDFYQWYSREALGNQTPFLNVTYSPLVVGKGGAISTVAGTTPFFTTNASNPVLCGSMGDGDECIVSFEVNATGGLTESYEFWWIVLTDDASVTDVNSSKFNITIDAGSPAADSCTYGGSGNWEIDCLDNCEITSQVDVGGNDIIITGEGVTIFTESPINYVRLHIQGDSSTNICRVRTQ